MTDPIRGMLVMFRSQVFAALCLHGSIDHDPDQFRQDVQSLLGHLFHPFSR
jgi:hypothetical protein